MRYASRGTGRWGSRSRTAPDHPLGPQPSGPFTPLTPVKQAGGKSVRAWACEGDWDPARLASNTFSIEIPKGSGTFRQFPEVDRAAWFTLAEARRRINPAQVAILDELERQVATKSTKTY